MRLRLSVALWSDPHADVERIALFRFFCYRRKQASVWEPHGYWMA